jgi:acetyl esterase/lipase
LNDGAGRSALRRRTHRSPRAGHATLSAAGTPVEFHVHSGAPHGFDALAPKAAVTLRTVADRERVVREL